jgi:hypothetical protein
MAGVLQTRKVSKIGTMLSIAWFILYAVGGAVVFAKFAAAHSSHVAPYMPVVIFVWIAGFFVGHSLLERFCFVLHESKFKKRELVIIPQARTPAVETRGSSLPGLTSELSEDIGLRIKISEWQPIGTTVLALKDSPEMSILSVVYTTKGGKMKFHAEDLKFKGSNTFKSLQENCLSLHPTLRRSKKSLQRTSNSLKRDLTEMTYA